MTNLSNEPTGIIRTERGLTITGTRITLYDILGHLKAGWTPQLLQNWLSLTEEQLQTALTYLETHRHEVEAEFQLVLQTAEEIRQYWETRNKERLAQIAQLPPKPEQKAVRAKLLAWKTQHGLK